MANSIYQINKGINKTIEFKGLKGQYIWYLGGAVVVLMILYAILYILGINKLLCLIIMLPVGAVLIMQIYAMSKKYGEHGLMKAMAYRNVPNVIKSYSRSVFMKKKANVNNK